MCKVDFPGNAGPVGQGWTGPGNGQWVSWTELDRSDKAEPVQEMDSFPVLLFSPVLSFKTSKLGKTHTIKVVGMRNSFPTQPESSQKDIVRESYAQNTNCWF